MSSFPGEEVCRVPVRPEGQHPLPLRALLAAGGATPHGAQAVVQTPALGGPPLPCPVSGWQCSPKWVSGNPQAPPAEGRWSQQAGACRLCWSEYFKLFYTLGLLVTLYLN